MLFFKKRKKKEETIQVICKHCKESTEVKCSEIKAMYSGYKGRLSFFVDCPSCKEVTYIDETSIPARYVRKLYRETYD